ncbi:hypothetical protein Y032_0084g1700 [Ancylostoma ceylanicum]|nr:hypothetical protein Y032_0084g1700 [Ancylostoma ceylanicum]
MKNCKDVPLLTARAQKMKNRSIQVPVGFKNCLSGFVMAMATPQDQAAFIIAFWKSFKLTVDNLWRSEA